MPDLDVALPTLPDIDRHSEPKMGAIKPEVEITFERTEMVMRFQRLPSHLRPCPTHMSLAILPLSRPIINHILCSRSRPMSGNVGSNISESGMVTDVGVAVEIASLSVSVQELFLLPV